MKRSKYKRELDCWDVEGGERRDAGEGGLPEIRDQ